MAKRSKYFAEDRRAMRMADEYGLVVEYKDARRRGLSPLLALEEWDLIWPEDRINFSKE
jgi:hypothetical protein